LEINRRFLISGSIVATMSTNKEKLIFETKLIDLVRDRQWLYKKRCPDFKDTTMKEKVSDGMKNQKCLNQSFPWAFSINYVPNLVIHWYKIRTHVILYLKYS